MTIQHTLNQNAFSYVPKIKKLINNAPTFESNQMYEYTLKTMLNCSTPIASMNASQIAEFERDLIGSFKAFEWIK